jgi:hypothetical protein
LGAQNADSAWFLGGAVPSPRMAVCPVRRVGGLALHTYTGDPAMVSANSVMAVAISSNFSHDRRGALAHQCGAESLRAVLRPIPAGAVGGTAGR